MEQYQMHLANSANRTSRFSSFTKKAGNVLKGFSASLLSMGINMAIGEGIGTIITIIHDLATEMEQTEQRAKGFSGSLSGFNTEISDGQKKINELSEKYDELSKGVDNAGHVTTLPTEKYEEYKDIVQQLSELMPNLSTIFNEQGEAIGFTGGKIDDAKKKYQEYIQLQSQRLLSEGDEEGNTYQDVLNDYYNKTEKSENFWAALGGGMLQGAANVFTFGLLDANDFGYDTSNDLTIQGEIEQLERFIELTDQLDQTKVGQLSIDPIEETHVDYIEDILGQDLSDVAKLDTAKFNTFVQSVYTKIETLKQEQNAAFSKVQDGFVDMLTSDGAYWAIEDDAVKGNITSFVQSLSGDFFKEADVDLHNQNSVQTFIGEVVDSFAENRNGINDAYKNLLALDTDSIPVNESKQQVQEFCQHIAETFNMNSSAIPVLQKMLGFDYSETDRLIENVKGKLKDEYDSKTDELTPDELKLAADLKVSEGDLLSWDELIAKIKETNKTAEQTKPNSFTKAWNKLGKESDEDTAKESEKSKEKLLKLAEAGKLTTEAFEKSSVAQTILKETGLSAEEATQKINGLIKNVKQLDSMRKGITSITSAYDEKKDSKRHTVSASTLDSMYNTLGIDKWDNTNKKVWKNYKKYATDGKKSMTGIKKAQDELAASYVNSNNFLANLDDTNQDYYSTLLEEMGITNADTIVTNELAKKKGLAAIETADLTNMTSDEISKFIEEKGETDEARNAMKLFAFEKFYSNGKALNTTDDINQLINLTDSLGLTSTALQKYRDYKEGKITGNAGDEMVAQWKAMKELEKIQKKLRKKANVGVGKVNTTNGNKSNGKNNDKTKKPKETKTEIDWLSRRLTRMQSIIDLTTAKLQNLFSVKAKNKNLNDQIKETTTLMKQYGIAAKTYQKKADSIKKGSKKKKEKPLSKDIISKVTSGKITKANYKELIKKYGQSEADRINKYIDYTDKAQDAKKNKQDAKAKIRGLKQEKLQTWVDLYDSRIARAEAKESIQTTADGKKRAIDTQIKNINKSYDKQIEIAKLSKNKAEEDRLEYERQQKNKELHEKQLQNYVDEYNAKADLAEIHSNNAVGYKKQNIYISEQLSWLQQSYAKQKEIAELSKDKTEQDRLQAEYKAKEVELKQQQIDNLKADFENKISFTRNDEQDVNNRISEIEARGDIVQSSYYSALNRYEQDVLKSLRTELQELRSQQDSFTQGSPEWYDLQSDIQSVQNSISEANVSIIENNKKIGGLRQAMYDDIASRNSDASSEAQFLAGLLGDNLTDDKTGSLTKKGLGVLGTYGIELEAYNSTASAKTAQRAEIEKAIAAFNSGNAHALDTYGSLKAAEEKLAEVTKEQQEAITASYSSMKDIYDLMVKDYEAQLAYLKSIIDAKKQVLSMEKDLYDYQKNISNQTKNIATLEKQLAALKGDDSEEGRAKRAKLLVSLDEANQELQDTEYERYISDQQDMLDNMYNQYEDLLSELEKDFETVVKDGVKTINATASSISTTLKEYSDKYGYDPSEDMKEILRVMGSSNGTIVTTLPDTITNGLSELGKTFQSCANSIVSAYTGKPYVSGDNPNTTTGTGGGSGSGSKPNTSPTTTRYTKEHAEESALKNKLSEFSGTKNDPTKPLMEADPNKTYKSDLNKMLSKYGYVVKTGKGSGGLSYIKMFEQELGVFFGDGSYTKNGDAYKALQKKYPTKFQAGGIVRADGAPKTGDLVHVRVNPDETVMTQEFTKLLPDSVDIMKDFVKVPDYTSLLQSGNTGNTFGDIVINANLPNVRDSYDFASDLKNNLRTQRSIEVSVNDLMSKGKITNNIQRI